MTLRNKNVLDFTRQILLPRVNRPQMALALYPDKHGSTSVEVKVTTSSILLRFGTDEVTIQYTGSSVPDLASKINLTSIPVRAVALSRAIVLKTNDLIGTSTYIKIPADFNIYDRLSDGGAVLRISRYTVKYDRPSNIKLLPPYADSPGLPWRARIAVGSFTHEFRDRRFHFGIPESGDQTWSLAYGRPFKDIRASTVVVKSENVIQLPRFPVHWDSNNMLFYADEGPVSSSVIEDVDAYNGLVYLKSGFVPTESLRVDYTYLETAYIYPYLNVNAHFSHNPDLIDKFIVFYLVPMESTIASRTNRTVFHKIGDSLAGTIDSIENMDADIPLAIIGAYSVQQIIGSDRATILDTRIKGGGLADAGNLRSTVHVLDDVRLSIADKEVEPKIEDIYKDSASFADIGRWDGEPYPGAAAVVLDAPDHLRSLLPEKEIRQKATKFLAAGVYPVFEFSNVTGQYITGFSQDISSVGNLGLSGSVNNQTGSYWLSTSVSIPSGSVMVQWDSSLEPEIPVEKQEGTSVLSVPQGSGYFQPYLKSSPDAVIEWEERVLISPSGKKITVPQYSAWEKKRVVDSRAVGAGQLAKGYILAQADNEDMQFKNFSIFSPYRTDTTGEILKDISAELSIIDHRNESISNTGSRMINKSISDVTTLKESSQSNYAGVHPRYDGLFNLANTSYASTGFDSIAQSVGSGLVRSLGESAMFSEYNTSTDLYSSTTTYSYSLPGQLEALTDYMRYSLDSFGSGSPQYVSGMKGYENILTRLSGVSQIPVTGASWWIEPDYTVTAGVLSVDPISPTTGFPNVHSTGEDHRMTEVLPGMIGLWSALDDFDPTTMTGDQNNMPSYVKDSYSGIVANYVPLLLTGQPQDGEGNNVANHWYASHDRYGQFAGTIARDGMLIYEHILSGHKRVGSASSQVGSTTGDLTDYKDYIQNILNTVQSGFYETLLKGGILDANVPRLLEAYALATNRGIISSSEGGGDFDDTVTAYSGMYHTGIYIALRSMITTDGDIQERTAVDQELGPFSGTPPVDIVDALSAGCLYNDTYLAPLQGVIKTLTGVYSFSGTYPFDANLNDKGGGREAAVFRSLSRAFTRLQGKFSDPDMLDIFRKTKF